MFSHNTYKSERNCTIQFGYVNEKYDNSRSRELSADTPTVYFGPIGGISTYYTKKVKEIARKLTIEFHGVNEYYDSYITALSFDFQGNLKFPNKWKPVAILLCLASKRIIKLMLIYIHGNRYAYINSSIFEGFDG